MMTGASTADYAAQGLGRTGISAREKICSDTTAAASAVTMTSRLDRLCIVILGAATVLLVLVLWAIGAFSGAAAPDTYGYFGALHSGNPWGEYRHPLYGLMASWLGASSNEPGPIALAQGLLHVLAVVCLYAGSRVGGIRPIGALCLSLAALFSQSALYHFRLLLPESLAITALIFAFAGMLAASNSVAAFYRLLVPITVMCGLAYLLRPSFLPAILVVPVLWYMLATRKDQARRITRTLLLFGLVAAPFLLQSAYRWKTVGDFNVVSFGGYQMSALAGFMLTPELVADLPESVQPTAQSILSGRESAEAAGRLPRTPLNSAHERSFVSAALGYFDIYARSYDDFLSSEIAKLRAPEETWVAFNRRLARFSFATVITAPVRWAAWIAGGSARLAGRAIVTNAPMLAAMAVLLITALPAFTRRSPLGDCAADLAAVSIIALGWLAATGPLTVLVTFPATRYIDTSAMLLPAVPALLAAAVIRGWLSRQAPDRAKTGSSAKRD
jgi:hypothetical protein